MTTKIEWTDETWNPLRARNLATGGTGHFCVHASDGCRHCYAERLQPRWRNPIRFRRQDREKVELYLDERVLQKPLRWQRARKIFPCDMTDFALEDYPDEWLDALFAIAALTRRHTYQFLTKRAERLYKYMTLWPDGAARVHHVFSAAHAILNDVAGKKSWGASEPEFERAREAVSIWPLPNVWLGVSAEDQKNADARIPFLLKTPAAVRFVSFEPLLGKIEPRDEWLRPPFPNAVGLPILDWGIVGGESGQRARDCHLSDVRTLVSAFQAAKRAIFVKQLGAHPIDYSGVLDANVDLSKFKLFFKDRKGGDMSEWAPSLRVREFP
jgi:protein gp37